MLTRARQSPCALTQGARNIALAYDQANRRSKITFPGTLEQRMTYAKPWGRPSAISYFAGATPAQLDALTGATFDGDGRPISRTATAAVNGIPNAVNTLPTAFTASYTNNRLTTFNGAAWTYDAQGNLTGDGTNTYVWDVRNRLIQIKQGATVTASFEYDALNRRTKKIISAASTEYLHDGLTPVQEQRVGDITQLITGPGIDDYLSRITTTIGATPTTTTRNYLTDFLGSTTALADDAGAIKTTYGYEPYGEATVAGEATVNSFQYTGRENDATGLYYYRARYYSPKAKRFISEDPIGQSGGINTYGYVGGAPLSAIDPFGLSCVRVGRTTTCTPPGGPSVTFPTPPDWPRIIDSDSVNYHNYNIQVEADCVSADSMRSAIRNAPTPGTPMPATPEGTPNNATPYVGLLVNSPVISYAMNDGTVVNVTQPGHPLFPGYVVRTVASQGSGVLVSNYGEGTGSYQSPKSPYADAINGVWNGQTRGLVKGIPKTCGCPN